ncbi:MAG: CPBP family intramembrane metalloprotease [Eubacterium sp.]|nr:CPBP family intramembrane metalloprotease [Eubacterium sp.]
MKKAGSFFQSFLPFIFFLAINVVVTIITSIAFTARAMSSGTIDTNIFTYMDKLASDANYLQISSMIMGIIVIALFSIWYRRVFVRPLRSKPRKYWSGISFQVIIGLVFLGFGLQYVAQLVANTIGWAFPELMANYTELMNTTGYDQMTWILAVYALLLAPIGEELAFRGLTMRFARQWLPFWAANIFQAALFGIMHLNIVQGLYAFTMGLFLGWVCKKGHSIKHSIILHIIFNILGTVFIDFFDVTLALHDYAFYIVGIALTVFAMLIISFEFSDRNKRQKKHYEKVAEE